MAVKINVRGSKPPTKPARKPAGKRTAAKPAATAKRGPGRPRKTEAAPKATTTRKPRASTAMPTDAKSKKLLNDVAKAGKVRKDLEIKHKASVDALHQAAVAALEAGVPMARVAEVSGISRQWLYKMGEFAGRSNGDSAPAPTRSRVNTAATAKAAATRKTNATKRNATKSTGRKITVKSR